MSEANSADRTATVVSPLGVPSSSRLGPLDSKTVGLLVAGLWILWALLLFGGSALSEFVREAAAKDEIVLVSHLGSSAVLVTAAWIWFLGFSRSAVAATVTLFAAGMTAGAIGDFFNAGVLQDLIRLPDPVLGGIAAFALGHIAYIAGCVRVAREHGFQSRGRRAAAIAFWQVFGFISWFFVVYRGTKSGAGLLVWPALPYSLLLAGTAGIATYLALENRRFVPLAIGAILFLASDMILAFRMFHGDFPLAGHAVWMTYGPAQMLIVYSIGTAASGAAPGRMKTTAGSPA
jgi:YhhN family